MKTVFFLIKRKVLDHYVHLGSVRDFVKSIRILQKRAGGSSVLFVNGYILASALKDERVSTGLNNADILIPTGTLLKQGIWKLFKHAIDSVTIWKFLDTLVSELELETCEYFGDEKLKNQLVDKYPHLKLKVLSSGDFSSQATVSGKILLVCLPPKVQEVWIEEMRSQMEGCIIGLGALFLRPSFTKRIVYYFLFNWKVLCQKFI